MADDQAREEEFELLQLAEKAGRTDGDGPADVAEVVEVEEDGE